jgi:hypothetical protein
MLAKEIYWVCAHSRWGRHNTYESNNCEAHPGGGTCEEILFYYMVPLLKKRIAHTKVRCVEKVAIRNTSFCI